MQYTTSEFENIYTECFPAALRLASGMLVNEDEARDAVHEVFLKLWESDKKADNPKAFVLRSVRNACINRIKAIDTRERIRRQLMLEPPEDDFDPDIRNMEVLGAIESLLTAREKEVVGKIYTDGLSYRKASESLGVTVAAINKNLVSALKKLRSHFKTGKS